ncbi:hypothetical protein [Stenotrophomonas sp.]|uniref:hypothetical protein n=1 Tax=Stenotrophomonas sp. TaxID=69392 RepID=UPI00333E53A6
MQHAGSRIEIDVSYQLSEYRQLLHEGTGKACAAVAGGLSHRTGRGGAMPIPFREMDTEKRQQFERLLASVPVVILEPAH